jgi:hypothetical protein
MDIYRVIPAVTRDLLFSGLIRRTAHSVASYDTKGNVGDLSSQVTNNVTQVCCTYHRLILILIQECIDVLG